MKFGVVACSEIFQVSNFVAYRVVERCIEGFFVANVRERDPWKNLGVDGRIILKFIFKKLVGECVLD
jgi:hypothetical protein